MAIIEKINWLSKEGLEAEVTISDGRNQVVCFAHPFDKKIGEEVLEPLYAFDTNHLVRSDDKVFLIEKTGHAFAYYLTGRLKNKSKGLVEIDNIEVEVDTPLPNDISDGEFVSFRCERLDLI